MRPFVADAAMLPLTSTILSVNLKSMARIFQ
jgi:hypothetical protein